MWNNLFKISLLFIFLFLLSGCRLNIEFARTFIKPVPFERTKWFALEEGLGWEVASQFRPGMARKLVAENILIGKSRAEIFELLGDNEDDGFDSEKEIRYGLEEIYGWNIDPVAIEYLKITFNSEDRCEKAEIEFYKTMDWEG